MYAYVWQINHNPEFCVYTVQQTRIMNYIRDGHIYRVVYIYLPM